MGGCGSVDVERAADFGCHFLRSGLGMADSVVGFGVSVGIDEMS